MKPNKRMLSLSLSLICSLFGAWAVVRHNASHGQESHPTPIPSVRNHDKEDPIVDYHPIETANAARNDKRHFRGAKYNQSQWNVDPSDTSDTTVRVDFIDPHLPAFPTTQSALVIIGSVKDTTAHLSNDRTGIYTEFQVGINEVLKSDSKRSLVQTELIDVVREGGRVRFPSGRIHLYKISDAGMPRVGRTYVFFLVRSAGDSYELLTGYELHHEKVIPLDNIRSTSSYRKVSPSVLLTELKAKVAGLPLTQELPFKNESQESGASMYASTPLGHISPKEPWD